MSIESVLQAWAESDKGKNILKGVALEGLKRGVVYGSKTKGGKVHEPEWYALEFKRMLQERVRDIERYGRNRRKMDFADGDKVKLGEQHFDESTQRYVVTLYFDREAVQRDSLDPDNYEDGITHIAAHINYGWSASGAFKGTYPDGSIGWTLREREPEYFMEDTINRFNNTYQKYGITAVIGEDFQTNYND